MSKKNNSKKAKAPRPMRKYEVARPLKENEISRQELVVFNTIKRAPATVAEVTVSARAQMKSKSKNLQSCCAWYLNRLRQRHLIRVAK